MNIRSAAIAFFVALLAWVATVQAADLDRPLILVARPELRGGLFAATVLVVTPAGGGRHAGFIVNRQTNVDVVVTSPETAAVRTVAPLYVGGPLDADHVFALVPRREKPRRAFL